MPEGNETRFYSTTQQISSYCYAVKLLKKSRLICYKKVYGFKINDTTLVKSIIFCQLFNNSLTIPL
ncbi:hypothetical protein M23134_04347 [Microscilla marina ATCC 23134]|uniref:Uncharacterized protein n=1 Tax=Microscilla marina ATCC 23134 TaxID=313606 RepID=A1ZLW8_MICM2|nr:hypothetical protein M23134_04347 [Microscilla marina ATCC 23134]